MLPAPANGPIRLSPSDPDVVVFSGNDRVYRSADGLRSWTPVLTPAGRPDDIEFAPSDPHVVVLATQGYFIYFSGDGGATWPRHTGFRTDGIL
jgi:photosystem II stability/assembly factor-like uncharacterized protein